MAHYIDERELRLLNRRRIIEEQEERKRIQESIRQLQIQRDQHINALRNRQQLNVNNMQDDTEQQLSDHGSQGSHITIDRCFGSNESVFDRNVPNTYSARNVTQSTPLQPTRSILRTSTVQRDVKNEKRGDGQASRVTLLDRPDSYTVEENSHSQTGYDPYMNFSSEDMGFGLFGPEDRISNPSEVDRNRVGQIEGDSAEENGTRRAIGDQSSFLNFMDREIESMDKQLKTLQSRNSQTIDRQRATGNSQLDESQTHIQPMNITDRRTQMNKADTLQSAGFKSQLQKSSETKDTDRDRSQIPHMVEDYEEGLQRYLKEKKERQELSNWLNRKDTKFDEGKADINGSLRQHMSENKDDEIRSCRSDISKQEIDAQIANLLRLRRKIDDDGEEETDLKRKTDYPPILKREVQYTGLHSNEGFTARRTDGQNQFVKGTDYDRSLVDSQFRQDPIREADRNQELPPRSRQPVIHNKDRGRMDDSKQMPNAGRYETMKRENDPKQDIESESLKEEIKLREDRKRKAMLLKTREMMLMKKEQLQRERERDLELLERIKREQKDPYEQLLVKKEQELNLRFKKFKETEALLNEREKRLTEDDLRQKLNLTRIEEELARKEQELNALDQRQLMEDTLPYDMGGTIRYTEQSTERKLAPEIKPTERKSALEIQETERKPTATASTSQDRPFIFPKISTFSAEDPKPKSESSFEEWKYEVKCLRKDNMYSEAVIGQVVRKSLKGDAKRVLVQMKEGATVDDILQKLEGMYGNVATPMSILQEFYTVYQKQDESVAAWGLRLESILQKAIEKGQVRQDDRDNLLRSEKLKLATNIHFHECKSFDLLRQKVRAQEYEMKLGTAAQHQAVHTERKGEAEFTESKADMILEKIAKLEKRLNNRRWYGKNKQQQQQNRNQTQDQNTALRGGENSSRITGETQQQGNLNP